MFKTSSLRSTSGYKTQVGQGTNVSQNLNSPYGMVSDPNGHAYCADPGNSWTVKYNINEKSTFLINENR